MTGCSRYSCSSSNSSGMWWCERHGCGARLGIPSFSCKRERYRSTNAKRPRREIEGSLNSLHNASCLMVSRRGYHIWISSRNRKEEQMKGGPCQQLRVGLVSIKPHPKTPLQPPLVLRRTTDALRAGLELVSGGYRAAVQEGFSGSQFSCAGVG